MTITHMTLQNYYILLRHHFRSTSGILFLPRRKLVDSVQSIIRNNNEEQPRVGARFVKHLVTEDCFNFLDGLSFGALSLLVAEAHSAVLDRPSSLFPIPLEQSNPWLSYQSAVNADFDGDHQLDRPA